MNRDVLISGAGVGGPVLAYWLARRGFRPTVVERSAGTRSSGNPVDVRGEAFAIAGQMGVVPALRAAATVAKSMTFVTASGREYGRIALQRKKDQEVEIPRADLSRILYEASKDAGEYLFDDSIESLSSSDSGVEVTFASGLQRRFDLVIGADGLHSQVRRLVWGPEESFIRHMGVYVATIAGPDGFETNDKVLIYNFPGRAVAIHPSTGKPGAAFLFRSPAIPGFDHRDTAQHKQILLNTYAAGKWRVPELLSAVRATDDLYFDSVSRVELTPWSRGRVALLGDSASSLSLFGDGSSLAITGAYTLATALAESPSNHDTALRAYESAHRLRTSRIAKAAPSAARLLIPKTWFGIGLRNALAYPLRKSA